LGAAVTRTVPCHAASTRTWSVRMQPMIDCALIYLVTGCNRGLQPCWGRWAGAGSRATRRRVAARVRPASPAASSDPWTAPPITHPARQVGGDLAWWGCERWRPSDTSMPAIGNSTRSVDPRSSNCRPLRPPAPGCRFPGAMPGSTTIDVPPTVDRVTIVGGDGDASDSIFLRPGSPPSVISSLRICWLPSSPASPVPVQYPRRPICRKPFTAHRAGLDQPAHRRRPVPVKRPEWVTGIGVGVEMDHTAGPSPVRPSRWRRERDRVVARRGST